MSIQFQNELGELRKRCDAQQLQIELIAGSLDTITKAVEELTALLRAQTRLSTPPAKGRAA